jgi:sugar lactone lactonase YvrE
MRKVMSRRPGQALVEFSLFAPMLMTILMGAFIGGTGLNNKQVGQGAVRRGAMLAARLGAGNRIGGATQTQVDNDIVDTVVGVARTMPYTRLTELIIYRPGPALARGGDVDLSRDVYDRFLFTPTNSPYPDTAHQAFDLALRTSEVPDEVPIGVKLTWQYRPGAGGVDITMSEHAVVWTADETTTVYASGRLSKVVAYDPSGKAIKTLDAQSGGSSENAACFNRSGFLFVPDFSNRSITSFDPAGNRTGALRIGGAKPDPESCAVDAAGNLYVGHADEHVVDEFGPTGNLLRTLTLAVDRNGIDHLLLRPDNCTLLYTSEGDLVKQFDVCTGLQLADFANVIGPCYQLAARNNGEVFVGCVSAVFRLSPGGATIQAYPPGSFGSSGLVRSVAMDPDGSSLWAADQNPPVIYHIDILSGGLIKSFPAPETLLVNALTVTSRDLDP